MTKRTAATAGAGTAAPAPETKDTTVHTCAHPRDEFTGIGGTYTRDPLTGVRTRVLPAAPADGADTAAA